MVRVDDYPELAAIVAEREERRSRVEEGVAAPEQAADPSAEPARVTAYAPLFTARTAAVAASAQLLVTWDDADLEQLAGDSRPAARAWAHGLDVCSRRPGHAVPTTQVVNDAAAEIVGRFADQDALDRLLIRKYRGLGRPVRLISGEQLGHHDGQRYWVVTEEQATAWDRVRSRRAPED